ncbi:SOS response-associated peptidase family protein [Pontixanthobacter sp. CEM42]|uniref:SOS response-associated peptidase family protein n=1 Tax=Pontixanthobacter sp. CEM42 TaxID=2792077 RepID=UPI001AE02496|nr:SOS response-associated peptidase family protein [Pontixanthobacter sp. CEM42]
MTHLFRLDANAATIAEIFGAIQGDDPWSGGHIAPASFAPIITAGRELIPGPLRKRGKRRVTPRVWGVPPPPSVQYDGRNAVLTVRNPHSPFWIGNLRNSEFRCLIPATSFMEWSSSVDAQGRRKQLWFAPSDQPVFAIAGVWKDSEVPSFALLTCEANAALRREGRDRMPAILPADPKAQELWLHGEWRRAEALLQPYSSSLMCSAERGPRG